MIDKLAAQTAISNIFGQYRALSSVDQNEIQSLKAGKLYELFVLSKLIEDLSQRGYHITFVGSKIKFKAGPGMVKQSDSHFDVHYQGQVHFQIFVNIEVKTIGSQNCKSQDLSCYHELDLAVLSAGTSGRPSHDLVALGVECKDVATMTKSIVREVLGLRRELSLLTEHQTSTLSSFMNTHQITVPADPPSEIWLVFSDHHGLNYQNSPEFFGIKLECWTP